MTAPSGRVVLVHGSMDRSASFIKVARRLPDLEVVRYDRTGYGRSTRPPTPRDLEGHVADLLDVVGDEPTTVVGHSLGGVVAVVAAGRRPEVIGSVGAFEAPMSWRPSWPASSAGGNALRADDPEEAAERFIRGILGDRVWERLPGRTRTERRAEGHALMAELASMRMAPPYDARQVPVPVLAGYGTESKPYHQEAARQLAEESPQGELMVIEGSGHGAHTSHPDQFAAFVRRATVRFAPCPST